MVLYVKEKVEEEGFGLTLTNKKIQPTKGEWCLLPTHEEAASVPTNNHIMEGTKLCTYYNMFKQNEGELLTS